MDALSTMCPRVVIFFRFGEEHPLLPCGNLPTGLYFSFTVYSTDGLVHWRMAADGARIEGAWERSPDGPEWTDDFVLTSIRIDAQ